MFISHLQCHWRMVTAMTFYAQDLLSLDFHSPLTISRNGLALRPLAAHGAPERWGIQLPHSNWLAPSESQDRVICQRERIASLSPVCKPPRTTLLFSPFLYPGSEDSYPVTPLNQSKSLSLKNIFSNLIRDVPFCQSALLVGLSRPALAHWGCQQSSPAFWFT